MNTEQLRVGDAERDEVTTALHEHFVQGRLTRDELDERLTATLSARTAGDLREVTRDLPGPALERPAGGGRDPWELGAAHWGRGPRGAAHLGRGRWEMDAAGRGPSPWPHGHWGPPRWRFGPLLLVALVLAAFTGWWMIFPLLAVVWFTAAFTGVRRLRRHHASLAARR